MFNLKRVYKSLEVVVFLGTLSVPLTLLCPSLIAQTAVDGAVAGTVVDRPGAALPQAAVVVHSTATNADSNITTDQSGYFRITRLVPGDYTVKVTAPGFSDYTAQHVTVEVGKLTEVSPRLGAAGTTATVQVT